MSDPTTYRSQVDLCDPWSITYWTVMFSLDAEQLREAVKAVGTAPDSIRQHLIAKSKGFVRPKVQIAQF